MAVPAQKFREIVFQLLYSFDIGQSTQENMTELLSNELAVTKNTVREANERALKIQSKLEEIDALIAKTSTEYAFERIQTVERNILRIGTYELLFDPSIPPKVVIAEAMRISKKFSTKESANFINAILDAIYKTTSGQKVDTGELSKIAKELEMHEQASEDAAKNMSDTQEHEH